MSDNLFQYKLAGMTITLFSNRIEIKRSVFGVGQTDTILIKTITNVESGIGKRFTVHTMDGKKHVLDISGKQAEELKTKLMDLL